MRPSEFWPCLVSELCRENGVSIRSLARQTGVNRASIHRFLAGRQSLQADKLDTILAAFGYELDAFPRREAA